MIDVIRSSVYDKWQSGLQRRQAMAWPAAQLDRLASRSYCDAAAARGGAFEFRINCGPVYRVHSLRRGEHRVVLLGGGEKSSQVRDITRAHALAEEWKE